MRSSPRSSARDTHGNAELALAFPQVGRRPPAQTDFDHILDIGDVQTVPGRTGAIDLHQIVGQLADAIDQRARHTLHIGDFGQHALGHPAQRRNIVTEHLDHDLAVDLRNAFENVVANRLREGRLDRRQCLQRLFHFIHHLPLADRALPFRLRFQIHQEFGHVDQFGVSAIFRATGLGNHGIDFRRFQQDAANLPVLRLRLADRNRRWQLHVEPQRPFVEFRQELGAQAWQGGKTQAQRHQRKSDHLDRVGETPLEHRRVRRLGKAHDRRVMMRQVFRQPLVAQERHQGQREYQGPDQREGDRVGHRRENPPLVPLQGEDRDVRGDDDDHREQGWPPHFDGRLDDGMQAKAVFPLVDSVIVKLFLHR